MPEQITATAWLVEKYNETMRGKHHKQLIILASPSLYAAFQSECQSFIRLTGPDSEDTGWHPIDGLMLKASTMYKLSDYWSGWSARFIIAENIEKFDFKLEND